MKPLRAGQALDAFCDEFLARHSDYLDGLMPPLEAVRMSAHAEACASCGRYDRIVRKSLVLARELPELEVSESFEQRLQRRLLVVRDEASTRSPAHGVAAALAIAATVAVISWSPLLLGGADHVGDAVSPAAVEMRDDFDYAGFGAASLLVDEGWSPVVVPQLPTMQAAGVLATLPGPYSPLIVTPPAHRTVRTVSSESSGID